MAGLKSYFSYHDVDIIPSKYKRQVLLPKIYREDELPLDSADIRKLLINCNNRRLKSYLLVLTHGMRAVEALAIRNRDIDFSSSPTKIHLRKEYSKIRVGRDIWISDEVTTELKYWLKFKYENPDRPREFNQDDLVFTIHKDAIRPELLYFKLVKEFQRLLKKVGMDERKEGGIGNRRKVTLHSLRRHAKTLISEQVSSDYSDYFIGHSKSTYWVMKEDQRKDIFVKKVMPYLVFLDFSSLESRGKSIESKLEEKDQQIAKLQTEVSERKLVHDDAFAILSDQVMKLTAQLEELKSQK